MQVGGTSEEMVGGAVEQQQQQQQQTELQNNQITMITNSPLPISPLALPPPLQSPMFQLGGGRNKELSMEDIYTFDEISEDLEVTNAAVVKRMSKDTDAVPNSGDANPLLRNGTQNVTDNNRSVSDQLRGSREDGFQNELKATINNFKSEEIHFLFILGSLGWF